MSAHKFKGGIHPLEGKELTAGKELRIAPLFDKYIVPVRQNIGAPPTLTVKKGDAVKKGQRIAEPGGFVSVPLHSPVCGTVGDIVEITGVTGASEQAVEIIADGTDEWDTGLDPIPDWADTEKDVLKKRILDAGIVGMGGAAFPTHVKLSPPPEKNIDTLIVNGAECEPFLTADHRLMLTRTEEALTGIAIAAKILKVSRIFVGVEDNKMDAIEKMAEAAAKFKITVVPLHVKYPQGAEKQLIYALTGRQVLEGGLPMDVGCVVMNIGTAAAVHDAVVLGHPLIERVTTVTGTPVVDPANYLVRIGTPIRKLLELSGGLKENPAKVIMGGPMMGFAQSNIDVPVAKNSSGVLLMAPEEIEQFEGNPCIRCSRCVKACPMNLLVPTLSTMIEAGEFTMAEHNYVMDCVECGTCAYICPAKRPLVQHFRRAKAEILAKRRKK
ncbi:MAG: electron transport complex subunit RsxC [Victivallales bacterium]|nr:electron transport complex subunit RsxC [Victivallales bacterium]